MTGRRTGTTDHGRGLTGLELLVLVAIIAGAAAAGLYWESTRPEGRPPSGIIPLSVEAAGRALVVAGETCGYWARDGTAGGIPVSFPPESKPGIDAISIPVQVVVGGGGLEMGSVSVAVRSGNTTTVLARDGSGRPGRSSWAVSEKLGVLPLLGADRDDLLEEPETFTLLVLPPGPLEPGGEVTVAVSAVPGVPLVITRDIPARVSPVTLLSL